MISRSIAEGIISSGSTIAAITITPKSCRAIYKICMYIITIITVIINLVILLTHQLALKVNIHQ